MTDLLRCVRCRTYWQPWAVRRTVVRDGGRECLNRLACDRRVAFQESLDRIVAMARKRRAA